MTAMPYLQGKCLALGYRPMAIVGSPLTPTLSPQAGRRSRPEIPSSLRRSLVTLSQRLLQRRLPGAMAEIAKPLVVEASGRIEREERVQHFGDLAERHLVDERGVEPGAGKIAADEQAEIPGHAADDADVAGIGPSTAVRASGDADAEALALEAVIAQPGLDRGDDVVAHPLGLGQRQSTGRQCRAGERPAFRGGQILGQAHAMLAQQVFNRVAILRPDLAHDDVLARHQDRVATEALDDLP